MPDFFDLTGPQFLLFYAGLIAAVYAAMWLVRRALGPSGPPEDRILDPLLVAHLRAGPAEAVRVAVVSMVQRGLLDATGNLLTAKTAASTPRDRLEIAIHDRCRGTLIEVSELIRDVEIARLGRERHERLVRAGLLTSAQGWAAQALIWIVGASALTVTAVYKADLGLDRGRPIGWLVLLASVAVVGSLLIVFRRRTPRGHHVLADLQTLLAGVRDRPEAASDGASELMLAATYGMAAVATVPALEFADSLFGRKSCGTSGGCGGAFGGGSGCGSGGSDGGGGGGCGSGGGCGGGCGGCGS